MATPMSPGVPTWTLADRLRKAREHAELKQAQLAAELGIARSSVVAYEAGKTPRRPVLVSWAMRCGVPLEWLLTGDEPADRGPDGGVTQPVSSSRCIALRPLRQGRALTLVASNPTRAA